MAETDPRSADHLVASPLKPEEPAKHTGDVDERVARVRKAVAAGVEQLDEWFDATVQFLESSFEPLEAQLPPTARDMAGRAKEQVRELRSQLRQLVSPGS